MTAQNGIIKRSFEFSFNPELLKLITAHKYAEVRDYWHNELVELEKDRQIALKTFNKAVYPDIWDQWCHALRMYDRYYVLADLKEKGEKRAW